MDMEHEQVVQFEQNLAACYETEYLLSMKVEDQGFYAYDDISEVSTVFTVHEPQSRESFDIDNEEMQTEESLSHDTCTQWSSIHAHINNNQANFHALVSEQRSRDSLDEDHSDGPNRKKVCLRQSES